MKLDEDAGLPLVFREMQRMHRSRLQRVLNEYGLYMGQPMILFALERIPDATQKELADALHISSATHHHKPAADGKGGPFDPHHRPAGYPLQPYRADR